jgi:hypothetical protein
MIKGFHQRPAEIVAEAHHRTPEPSSRRRTIIIFLGVIAVIGWIYFFFFSDYFAIHAVEISGTQRLKRGEVERALYTALDEVHVWPLQARNIFSVNADDVQKQLKYSLYVENVTVDKKYPDILRLKVTERESSVIVITQGDVGEIDRHGVVSRELSSSEAEPLLRGPDSSDRSPSAMPVLSITSVTGTLLEGDQFITENQMGRWLDTFSELRKRGFGYRSASLEFTSSTKLDIAMFESYHVYFDLLMPIDDQITGYFAFMKSKKPDQVIYSYVDARIPGRIYYK